MAAAIVPLVVNAISFIAPLLPPLISKVESAFGPRTGETKLETVLNGVKAILTPVATAGMVNGVPSDAELKAAIEAVLAQMKITGTVTQQVASPTGSGQMVSIPMQLVGTLKPM